MFCILFSEWCWRLSDQGSLVEKQLNIRAIRLNILITVDCFIFFLVYALSLCKNMRTFFKNRTYFRDHARCYKLYILPISSIEVFVVVKPSNPDIAEGYIVMSFWDRMTKVLRPQKKTLLILSELGDLCLFKSPLSCWQEAFPVMAA